MAGNAAARVATVAEADGRAVIAAEVAVVAVGGWGGTCDVGAGGRVVAAAKADTRA